MKENNKLNEEESTIKPKGMLSWLKKPWFWIILVLSIFTLGNPNNAAKIKELEAHVTELESSLVELTDSNEESKDNLSALQDEYDTYKDEVETATKQAISEAEEKAREDERAKIEESRIKAEQEAESQKQAEQEAQAATQQSQTPISETVWITATGSKYHNKNNCGNTNPAKTTQLTREQATANGYGPCGRCY